MRLATFNVQNLFDRARLLAADTWSDGRRLLEAYTALTVLLQRTSYTEERKQEILDLLDQLGLARSDENALVRLRQNRGRLVSRSREGVPRIVAEGRGDWVGWLELRRASASELTIRHTAQVVHDLDADIVGVVEADDRWALRHFNADQLTPLGGRLFAQIMLIDGNDERGIDVGILAKSSPKLQHMVSHVDDSDLGGPIFSRDCAEYLFDVRGARLLVMVNHFKSKGYGGSAATRKRKRQAQRVREIYEQRRAQGFDLIAVIGDLNDSPDSDALSPLLGSGGTGVAAEPSDLVEVAALPDFDDGGWPGTYSTGRAAYKIDYILCSPGLFALADAGGYFRRGAWTASGRWPMYDTLTRAQDAASDHAAVWVDVNL